MEHLCKSCIDLLKDDWYYKSDVIEVMVVSQELCDNIIDNTGVRNADKKLKYPKDASIIKLKRRIL